jgi:hypothetical protein
LQNRRRSCTSIARCRATGAACSVTHPAGARAVQALLERSWSQSTVVPQRPTPSNRVERQRGEETRPARVGGDRISRRKHHPCETAASFRAIEERVGQLEACVLGQVRQRERRRLRGSSDSESCAAHHRLGSSSHRIRERKAKAQNSRLVGAAAEGDRERRCIRCIHNDDRARSACQQHRSNACCCRGATCSHSASAARRARRGQRLRLRLSLGKRVRTEPTKAC